MEKGVHATRARILDHIVEQFANYRKECATSTSSSQLVLPDTLKKYPLYLLSALKSPVSQNILVFNHFLGLLTPIKNEC
jgi:hypothetical protein